MEPSNGKPAPKRAPLRSPRVDCLVDARADLVQGLAWDEQTHRVFWIDAPVGQLHAVSLTSGVVQSWSLPCAVNAIALCRDGRVVVALVDGVYLFDLVSHDLHFLTALETPEAGAGVGGGVGPDGAFWICGAGPEPDRALLRLAPDGTTSRVKETDALASCGLAWSADGRTMYGGAVDVEGAYWRCDASDASVRRFSRGGEVMARIPLPVPAPTTCCFGGVDRRLLLVASRRAGLDGRTLSGAPTSGGIFMVPVDVAGVRVRRFGAAGAGAGAEKT